MDVARLSLMSVVRSFYYATTSVSENVFRQTEFADSEYRRLVWWRDGMPDSSDSPTDLELVDAINGGDHDAFETLYYRYNDWVTQLAYRFTGNHDDALDVLQETFAYLVRKFPGFELTARMTTFLYPAVRNLSIAARKKRQQATSSDENLDLFPQAVEEDMTVRDDFSELLNSLSDAHREILLLRFVDDLTQPEIAETLQLPLGTVKSRLHHAVHAVKNSPAVAALLARERSKPAD